MKRVLKAIGALPFRWLPNRLRGRLMQLMLEGACSQPPRKAMRDVLELEEQCAAYVNQAAARYDGGLHAKHRLMRYHDFFVERVRAGERVLDIGCGPGAVAYSLATRAGALVTGIDTNEAFLRFARERYRHPHLTFVQGDAWTDLPREDVDVVALSNILEHLDRREEFLRAIVRQVHPKRVLIRVPMINRDWRVPLRQELGLFPFSDPTHTTEYTEESFEEEMRAADLTLTHLQINWGEIWAEVVPATVSDACRV